MDKKSSYIIPLEELLELIKASGYDLSIQQILEIQSSLLAVSVARLGLDRLKFVITPVIAKNDEEQRHIHLIIDAYIAEKTKASDTPTPPLTRWLRKHKQFVFALKIAGFLLIAATAILIYMFSNNKLQTPKSTKPIVATKRNTITSSPKPAQQPENRSVKTVATPVITSKGIEINAQASGRYIMPVSINFNLQMSLTFGTISGIIMAWIVFYERKKKMEMKERQRMEDAIFITRKEDKKRASHAGFEPKGDMGQPTVQFPDMDYLIHQPRFLQKIKSHLKRPAVIQNPGFDIQKSIHKSVRNAGFSSVVYSSDWKDRKYLFLTDNRQPEAHITCFLNHVVNALSAAITTVVRYNYNGDAGMVQDMYGNWMSLESLAYRYENYHLIIIGNGYSLFENDYMMLKKKLHDTFQKWKFRSIITPVPLPDWSYHEEQLQKNNFQLVPAETDAVELLAKAIAEDTVVIRQQLYKRLEHTYSITSSNFQTVHGLKEYLNNEKCFQLVCSLAVYPRLQWALTLALFSALLKNNTTGEPSAELTHDLLLKMARIPWLHADRLDDNIRLQLLNSLTVETETKARETILGLLDKARPDTANDSPAFTELNTQYNINAFFLFSHDQYKYQMYAGAKEVISDYWNGLTEWALKEYVDKSRNALLPRYKSNHATVQEFLLHEKQFDKWNISFSKVVYVTLPAILLYIAFAIFKPAFVYPPDNFKNVSFATIINKESNCTPQLSYVINTTNGKADTIVLNQMTTSDTLTIKDIKYNEIVNFELWTTDSLMRPISIAATDSFFEIKTTCN